MLRSLLQIAYSSTDHWPVPDWINLPMCVFRQKQKGKQLIFWLKSQPKKTVNVAVDTPCLASICFCLLLFFLSSCYWQIMPKKVGVKTSFLWNTLPRDIMTALWGRLFLLNFQKNVFCLAIVWKQTITASTFLAFCAVLYLLQEAITFQG